MKIRKLFAIMSLAAMAMTLSFNVYSACGVNPDADKNTGHCRNNSEGQATCFSSGSGPACSHNVTIGPPVIE